MATLAFETDSDTEQLLQVFAATLSEKDLRRFAAIEARQRGYGGITYVAKVLGCSEKTIERGIAELKLISESDEGLDPASGRVRREGAGRKKKLNRNPKRSRS
jgi:hypothetical protein